MQSESDQSVRREDVFPSTVVASSSPLWSLTEVLKHTMTLTRCTGQAPGPRKRRAECSLANERAGSLNSGMGWGRLLQK